MLELKPRELPQEPAAQATPAAQKAALWGDALSLAEGGLLADVAVLIDLIRVYLPVVGVAFAPLLPAPFALLVLRRGARPTLLAVAVATLLVSLMVGPHYGWRMGVSGLVGLALGVVMQKRLRPALIVVAGIVATSLAAYGFFLVSLWALAVPVKDLIAELQNVFHTANGIAAFVAGHLGLQAFWQQVAPPLLAVENWLALNWPLVAFALVFCWAVGAVVIHYALTNWLMRLFGFAVPPFPSPRVERLAQRAVRVARRLCGSRKSRRTAG